ncbi:MAG: LL-diaminopimelate aminotransferase [Cyanobacteria bacterium P01_F01_bin.150]
MATRNENLNNLLTSSSFADMVRNKLMKTIKEYRISHPRQEIYMMAWGDTTHCLSPTIVEALVDASHQLGHPSTYTGYGEFEGSTELRESICNSYYKDYDVEFNPDEIFVGDGAQSVTFDIQELFGVDNSVALQDPIYPPYLEANLFTGRTEIVYLPCDEKNDFVPAPPDSRVDIIYLCFPNNPTGAVATRSQLNAFVEYAKRNNSIIIFDAVYSAFISEPDIPRSIYEIPGANECAIEIGSFSKMAGFTGLRLGWAVIPNALTLENTAMGELTEMFRVAQSIKFWGASSLAQQGGIAALSKQGKQECQKIVDFYMDSAKLLKNGLTSPDLTCFGGIHNPYIWVKGADGQSSWDVFHYLLANAGIAGIPGHFFGASGEGFVRLSALSHHEQIDKAMNQYKSLV